MGYGLLGETIREFLSKEKKKKTLRELFYHLRCSGFTNQRMMVDWSLFLILIVKLLNLIISGVIIDHSLVLIFILMKSHWLEKSWKEPINEDQRCFLPRYKTKPREPVSSLYKPFAHHLLTPQILQQQTINITYNSPLLFFCSFQTQRNTKVGEFKWIERRWFCLRQLRNLMFQSIQLLLLVTSVPLCHGNKPLSFKHNSFLSDVLLYWRLNKN